MEIRRILAKAGRWLTALLVGAVIFNGCDSKRDKAPEQPYKDLVSAEIVDLDGDGDSDIIIYRRVERSTDEGLRGGIWENKPILFFENDGDAFLSKVDYSTIAERRERLERERYDEAYSRLLQLADRDHDGVLSFREQAEAWRRMGYKDLFIESRGSEQFEKPKYTGWIEGAIREYEQEKNDNTR